MCLSLSYYWFLPLSEEIISVLAPESYYDAIEIVIILSMFYGSLFLACKNQLIFAKKTYCASLLS